MDGEAMSYENPTILELRGMGHNFVRLVPQGHSHRGAGVLVSVQNLLTDWDQLVERADRVEAENAALRETLAALTTALTQDHPVNRVYTTDEAVDELGVRAEYEDAKTGDRSHRG
jgi:hypothetical protein